MYRLRLCFFTCLLWLPVGAINAEGDTPSTTQDDSGLLLGFDKAELDEIASSNRPSKPAAAARAERVTSEKSNVGSVLGFDKAELDLLMTNRLPASMSSNQGDEKKRDASRTQNSPAATTSQIATTLANKNTGSPRSSIGMLTGDIRDIHYLLGKDIAELTARKGLKIDIKPSAGTLDNIRRMASSENAGLAIVRSDVIEFLSTTQGPGKHSIIDELRPVFSLYNEEIHLLARKSIKTLTDLNNKRVIIGELASGAPITANIVFNKLGIDIEPITDIAPDKALKQFILGNADAVFFIGGKPISYISGFLEMKNDENLKKYTDDVHLIAIEDKRLTETYNTAEIIPTDYQSSRGNHRLTEKAVPTIAVQALLVSYNFANNKSPYFKLRCQQINQLNKIVRKNLEAMAANENKNHHPKWAEVDLDQLTKLPDNQCLIEADPIKNDLKAIDCYLQTGKRCK